jgi:uncharacterized secreted protein with C-terminal beta-propeller domain
MYVHGDSLVVLVSLAGWRIASDSLHGSAVEQTTALIYDLGDSRRSPKLIHELGQDGYLIASRMLEGKLYLLTNYGIYYHGELSPDQPEGFIPLCRADGTQELIAPDNMLIWPGVPSSSQTVICSYDIGSGTIESSQSILGAGNTIYMSHNNLYLARNVYDNGLVNTYTDEQYTVTEYRQGSRTEIVRFALNGGAITLEATGEIDGYLLNQFAMDEFEGYLRCVTTTDSSHYRIYTDEKRGWQNYEWISSGSWNSLFVLDISLNVVGEISELAEDERVYSVRFDGNVGYFVTFRQVDPLFSADLSNPYSPKIMGELKIPGFSQYLHVYGEGRMFGLGRDADEDTGRVRGIKLSMFDTSDPFNLSEKHQLILDSYYSEALYNHKAILILPGKSIIAFPIETGYVCYGYDDNSGFYKRGEYDSSEYYGNSRGLYIGDYAYIIVGDSVTILDLELLISVGQLTI